MEGEGRERGGMEGKGGRGSREEGRTDTVHDVMNFRRFKAIDFLFTIAALHTTGIVV